MKVINKLTMPVLLLLSATTLAEEQRQLSYSYIELGYEQAKSTEGDKLKADGAFINGSFEVGSNVFLTAGYGAGETEDFSVVYDDGWSLYLLDGSVKSTFLSVGVGGFIPLADNVDLIGQFSVINGKYKYEGDFGFLLNSESDNGWGAGIGIRSMLSSWFELSGGIRHVDIFEDSDTAFVLAARAHFSKLFSLGLSYTKYSDENQVSLSARFSF